jgi:hypothetical protein
MDKFLFAIGGGIAAAPFLAMAVLLFVYFMRRAVSRRQIRLGKPTGFCPSSAALGLIFLFAQTFYRPTVSHVVEARLQDDVEEDDNCDPETSEMNLDHQLRKIRRGEPVDDLVLRL